MNSSLFFCLACQLNRKIGQIERQKILLLIDNCSVYENVDTLSNLKHVYIEFLPRNIMRKLQPLDVGLITSIKIRYLWRQREHLIDLLEVDERDIYEI